MTKTEAIELITGTTDGKHGECAEAMGISRSYFAGLPEELPLKFKLLAIGAAYMNGRRIPTKFRDELATDPR